MAIKELSNVIQIDGTDYNVHAKTTEKLVNKLTLSVKQGEAAATKLFDFDGSADTSKTINIPTYKLTKSGSTITLTGSDGVTSSITDSNTGDMLKSVYDTNNNGIVDNAEKLGGTAAADYAKKSDLFSKNYNDLTNKPTIPTDTNQKIKTGSVTFGANDVVEFVAGTNVSIAGDASNKKITISSTGGTGGTSDVASKIKVTMDNNTTKDATISVKSEDPSGGNVGDIWFKF
jgi:hypothetical protein